LREALTIATEKLKVVKAKIRESEEMKCIALNTSKLNYMDPRISVAFAKFHNIPITKIFPNQVLSKFPWALEVHPGFVF